ncbi:YraN family protein [Leptothermofonsia sp. ETS-13]|uniref:YraN family protein n=1 Tax=Leptothermofonsia sp. ETS-13 TaxID=3035696 RepID=UPI003BA11EFB
MPQKPNSKPPHPQTGSSRIIQRSKSPDLGALGEELVAQWLQEHGWRLLERRWHCRWGELDLVIAQIDPANPACCLSIAFVEVKTRSQGNWDADGVLALTCRKQAKLWKAAQLFLADHPHLAELPCRFDVALVTCYPAKTDVSGKREAALVTANYHLILQDYIPSAFTL